MIYKEFPPDRLLTKFIKSYWWFDNSTAEKLDFTILPDGYFDLIVSLERYKQQEISLTGLWTKPVDVSIEPGRQLFGIRFKLLAADYILKQKISAILNSEQVMNSGFWQLDQLSFNNVETIIEKLNKTIFSAISDQKGIDIRKENLFNLLYQTNGELSVDGYSQHVFWSSRQINRYFQDRFGVPLKSYCKILKCFASFSSVKKGQFFPEQNYFDQSHFIKDMKEITGNNPTKLFENKNDRFLQLATMEEQ